MMKHEFEGADGLWHGIEPVQRNSRKMALGIVPVLSYDSALTDEICGSFKNRPGSQMMAGRLSKTQAVQRILPSDS